MTRAVAYFGAAFLLLPVVVIVIASFTEVRYISFPPKGFTLDWYAAALVRREFLGSLQLSLTVAGISALIATAIGTLSCLVLRRSGPATRAAATALVMSPLVLPGVVTGIALLQFFSLLGMNLSLTSLVLGHVLITVPYVVRLVSDSLNALPANLEWAAASLGAAPARAVTAVVLPCIKSGLIGGAIFAFIVSFENVTISVFLSAPQMTTLPVRVFGYTDQAIETWLVAICSMTIFFTVALIFAIERVIGLQRIFYSGKG